MAEWRAYSTQDGECFGGVAPDDWAEDEAQERAESLFGKDVYVELVDFF